jgi:GDP-mannose 6-dehydrogenase
MVSRVNRIAVFGLGYVGCVTASCFAKLGNQVIGVDVDERKLESIRAGKATFIEPELDPIVERAVGDGRLTATPSAEEAVNSSDIGFICVGTPSSANGVFSVEQLHRASSELAAALTKNPKPYVVVIRSTVFPGTCEDVVGPIFKSCPGVSVVSNPEFLREGAAVSDFMNPSLIVVGGPDAASKLIAGLYEPLDCEASCVSLRTAELIKYACNAFHALKIGFANEIGTLAERFEIDPGEVMGTLCRDTRLNVSSAYLKPGPPFGGSCLPKDLRAINFKATRLDLELPLLGSILRSNNEHLLRGAAKVLDLPQGSIGVFGLTFKENTDDLRESPVVDLLEILIGKGRDVRVFDPHIRLEEIYGANRNFVLNAIPHIAKLLQSDLDRMISEADYLVVTQKPSAAHAEALIAAGKPIINLAGSVSGKLTPVELIAK